MKLIPLSKAKKKDPFFSNVELLVHFDGSNGSTDFPDFSKNTYVDTSFGNVSVSTAQAEFNQSAVFDGDGDYIEYNIGSGGHLETFDFTIEAWIHIPASAYTERNTIIDRWADDDADKEFVLASIPDGAIRFEFFSGGFVESDFVTNTGVFSSDILTHIAVTRVDTVLRIFVNGVEAAQKVLGSGSNIRLSPLPVWTIGRTRSVLGQPHQDMDGYIDDVRVTIGEGRYSANFTPPTEPFPNQ